MYGGCVVVGHLEGHWALYLSKGKTESVNCSRAHQFAYHTVTTR